MITKGTKEYTAASQLANKLADYANTHKTYNKSFYDIAMTKLGTLLHSVKKAGGFAAQVAETLDKSMMNPYNEVVVKMSSKQAWIIACAAIENGIEF